MARSDLSASGVRETAGEQLRAPLQRRRSQPTQLRVVPAPHRNKVPEQTFGDRIGPHTRSTECSID